MRWPQTCQRPPEKGAEPCHRPAVWAMVDPLGVMIMCDLCRHTVVSEASTRYRQMVGSLIEKYTREGYDRDAMHKMMVEVEEQVLANLRPITPGGPRPPLSWGEFWVDGKEEEER